MEGNKAQTNDSANNSGAVNHYPRDERIRAAVEQLVRAVKESETYKEFDTINKHISAYPELKQKVDDYRRDVFLVQTGRRDSVDELKELEYRSDELHKDSVADEYLLLENDMCKMYQRIMYMLIDRSEFDPGIKF